jgi:tRNA-splicing ligase RtcB
MKKVIGSERLPIKLWLEDIEEEALDQARNMANLPFAFKHVAIMPDSHKGYGMPIGGVLATKDVIIPNAVGVDIGCFTGDTKIPLLDGKDHSLKELYDKKIKDFPVYSIDRNGRYVIGIADKVKKTRRNARLIRITLDTNKTITCTPDHQFLTKKLEYIQAKDLTNEHSLMPFHRLQDKDGYEVLGIRASNKNIKTHWVVAQSGLLGPIPKNEEAFNLIREKSRKNCISYNKAMETIKKYNLTHLHEIIDIETYSNKKHSVNHKIKKIKHLKEKQDVYCLTVEKYHNFALSDGVFVHNCGMCAIKTSFNHKMENSVNPDELMTTIKAVMKAARTNIPVGKRNHKEPKDLDMNHMSFSDAAWPLIKNAGYALGTLGSGNHFLELQIDEKGLLWIMIHSGSRNFGYKIAKHHNKVAIDLNRKWYCSVPEKHELAFLPVDSQEGQNYIIDMEYAVEFAYRNRQKMMYKMMEIVKNCFLKYLGHKVYFPKEIINIAHNYASLENHYGHNVWVHRKGATLAREDTIGIIPGSMGTSSYIVRGKGNRESFMSCSHGAGRTMSRTKAKNELDLAEEQKKLDDQGIIHSIRNKDDLEEAVSAYKDIDTVMENQEDLVEVLVKLKPLAVIKG